MSYLVRTAEEETPSRAEEEISRMYFSRSQEKSVFRKEGGKEDQCSTEKAYETLVTSVREVGCVQMWCRSGLKTGWLVRKQGCHMREHSHGRIRFLCVCFVILQNYYLSANRLCDECWIYRCCGLGEELLGLEMGNG